ncbi:MAG TPA: STAS domain-containing protein [Solirubrobacteraceae bacterium]|nr:STAS domain-containing protein [Solirubrobacteraceae bacterium]
MVEGPVPAGGPVPAESAAPSNEPFLPPRELASVRVEDRDGIAVASVSGEVDVSNVDEVARALTGLSNLHLGLVVDLSAVEYLDSTGISLLHDLAQRFRQRGQVLAVISPPGSPPRRMLELTALDVQAAVFDELGPAIAGLLADYDGGLAR